MAWSRDSRRSRRPTAFRVRQFRQASVGRCLVRAGFGEGAVELLRRGEGPHRRGDRAKEGRRPFGDAPASVIAEWKKTDPDTRKAAEEKMRAEWKKWMNDHENIFADIGAGVGKTKVVTTQGISDSKNDIMLYSLVEAETHEGAAKSFEGHPHLQIPQSSIEIMEVHALPGMK